MSFEIRDDASRTEFRSELLQIRRREVDGYRWSGFSDAGPALVRSRDMAGTQPALGRRLKIVAVRSDHHAVSGRQIERLTGREIDARLALVVARDVCAQDRVPGKIVAAGEIDHQRNIAIRDRRQQKPALEASKAGRHVGPGGKPVPREIEIARRGFGKIGIPEPRQNAIEVASVQHGELAERRAAGANLLHGRLVLVAPGIGEGQPVEAMAGGTENGLGLARNAGAKIDERAEDVEEQRLDGYHLVAVSAATDPPAACPSI